MRRRRMGPPPGPPGAAVGRLAHDTASGRTRYRSSDGPSEAGEQRWAARRRSRGSRGDRREQPPDAAPRLHQSPQIGCRILTQLFVEGRHGLEEIEELADTPTCLEDGRIGRRALGNAVAKDLEGRVDL